MMFFKGNVFIQASFLFLLTILSLIGVDFAFKIFIGFPKPQVSLTINDAVLNHKWRPNLNIVDHTRSIPYTVVTNSVSWLGRKEISIEKPENAIRIFYVGDSNTQGVVENNKKMATLVSTILNSKPNPTKKRIEVINTGTTSYSPSIYYLLIKNQILKYSPDIVVINVDMTDVLDDSLYRKLTKFDNNNMPVSIEPSGKNEKNIYKVEPGGLIKKSQLQEEITKIRNYLFTNSPTYFYLENKFTEIKGNKTARSLFGKAKIVPLDKDSWLNKDRTGNAKSNVDYSMNILTETIKLLEENSAIVVITGVPHFPQYNGAWSEYPHDVLKKISLKNNAYFLDTFNLLKNKIKGTDQKEYYWDNDPTHFNEEGNKVWVDIQADFLISLLTKKYEE